MLHLKDKYLVVQTNQNELPDSEIASLILKMPCLRLDHTQDWLNTVMLWLSDSESDNLIK